jgi:hypothetical protein
MNADPVDRLLAESSHLPPLSDTRMNALHWAIILEDALGITVSDEQITSGLLTDPERMRSLVASASPPG